MQIVTKFGVGIHSSRESVVTRRSTLGIRRSAVGLLSAWLIVYTYWGRPLSDGDELLLEKGLPDMTLYCDDTDRFWGVILGFMTINETQYYLSLVRIYRVNLFEIYVPISKKNTITFDIGASPNVESAVQNVA